MRSETDVDIFSGAGYYRVLDPRGGFLGYAYCLSDAIDIAGVSSDRTIEQKIDGAWVEISSQQPRESFMPFNLTSVGPITANLTSRLNSLVVGQETAISSVLDAFTLYESNLRDTSRPIGSFLLMGPTGSGKTHLVESITRVALNTEPIKVDCAEFAHSHEIAKLIGSPPGYLGHRETHPLLTQGRLDKQHTKELAISIVLFDEIEKASDTLWNLLLGILDKGTLTLGDNSGVDFSRCMIYMTSNLGAKEMQAHLSKSMGFPGMSPSSSDGKADRIVKAAAKKRFTPEFMNRMDNIIVFEQLTRNDLYPIFDLLANDLGSKLLTACSATFTVSDAAKSKIINDGYSSEYGARNLKRELFRSLTVPISKLVASKQLGTGHVVQVGLDSNGQLTYERSEAPSIGAKAA